MSQIKTEVKLVTPEMAAQMLCYNRDNRDIRDAVVDRYVNLLKTGQWKLTHQGIAFDTTGRLVDGQHRLSAIVRSGVPAEMMVSTGVDANSFKVLDQGAKRNVADILRIPKRVAEVIRHAARIYTHEVSPSPESLEKMYKAIGPITEELIAHSGRSTSYFSATAMKLGAIARILMGEDKAYVFSLYADLVNGNTETLPQIGHTLMKAHLTKRLHKDQTSILATALYVFHQKNKDFKQLRSDNESAGAFVRAALTTVYDK